MIVRSTSTLLILLGMVSSACCPSRDAGARAQEPLTARVWGEPRPSTAGDVHLSLHLRAVDMSPDGSYRQGLQVELRSDMRSAGWTWVNGRMAQGPRDGGEIEIFVTGDDSEQIGDECRRRPAPIQSWDYIVLKPGDSVRRVQGLDCFEFTGKRRVRIQVVYRDKNPNPPPPPLPHLRTFRILIAVHDLN